MSGSKEAKCARCIHLNVCKLKEDFLNAQEKMDNVILYKTPNDNGEATITKIRDIPWITVPLLLCKYYMENRDLTRFRDDEGNLSKGKE